MKANPKECISTQGNQVMGFSSFSIVGRSCTSLPPSYLTPMLLMNFVEDDIYEGKEGKGEKLEGEPEEQERDDNERQDPFFLN